MHIFNSLNWFQTYETLEDQETVTAGSQELEIQGIGTVKLALTLPGGKIKDITISNVRYIPQMHTNIISEGT